MLKLIDKKTKKTVMIIDDEGKEIFDDEWLKEKIAEQKKIKKPKKEKKHE